MKRILVAVFTVVFCFTFWSNALASIDFDISVFENNEDYEVIFDDMDDTGEIDLVSGGTVLGIVEDTTNSDLVIGTLDVRIIEGFPPVVRFTIFLNGEDWAFIEKVILKVGENRYTFEADSETEVLDGGDILERVILILSDESVEFLNDVGNSLLGNARFRLVGSSRNVDGDFYFDKAEVQQLYDDYVLSGALNNDFEAIKNTFLCEISRPNTQVTE